MASLQQVLLALDWLALAALVATASFVAVQVICGPGPRMRSTGRGR